MAKKDSPPSSKPRSLSPSLRAPANKRAKPRSAKNSRSTSTSDQNIWLLMRQLARKREDRYNSSPKGRARYKKYNLSPKGLSRSQQFRSPTNPSYVDSYQRANAGLGHLLANQKWRLKNALAKKDGQRISRGGNGSVATQKFGTRPSTQDVRKPAARK